MAFKQMEHIDQLTSFLQSSNLINSLNGIDVDFHTVNPHSTTIFIDRSIYFEWSYYFLLYTRGSQE